MKQTTKRPKMVRELYDELINKFSPNAITEDKSLTVLYQYLLRQMERSSMKGNFVHVPNEYLQSLLEKHLGYKHPEEEMRVK